MPLDPQDPRIEWATFGKQVEQFLEGDIGRHLVKLAQREIDEAIEKLKKVNPHEAIAVQMAQNQVKVAECVLSWLGGAIAEGHAALESLKEEQLSG